MTSGRAFLVVGCALAAAAGGWLYWPRASNQLGALPEDEGTEAV